MERKKVSEKNNTKETKKKNETIVKEEKVNKVKIEPKKEEKKG